MYVAFIFEYSETFQKKKNYDEQNGNSFKRVFVENLNFIGLKASLESNYTNLINLLFFSFYDE